MEASSSVRAGPWLTHPGQCPRSDHVRSDQITSQHTTQHLTSPHHHHTPQEEDYFAAGDVVGFKYVDLKDWIDGSIGGRGGLRVRGCEGVWV